MGVMPAWRPQRGLMDGPADSVYDRTLWMLLRAVVAHRPELPAVPMTIDPDDDRQARREISATARDVANLGYEVGELLLWPGSPNGPGSAHVVATVVTRMCREFAQRWSRDGPAGGVLAQFRREVDLLESSLDAVAVRATS